MKLTTAQSDRAAGVLLGAAVGDALGVPHEFQPAKTFALEDLPLGMPGGGPFKFAPGEWSDDTQMTLCIARAAHAGLDLSESDGLEAVAHAFAGWYKGGPRDVGGQVSAVLGGSKAGRGPAGLWSAMTGKAAGRYLAFPTSSAGNGSLMRTSPVALRHLDDPKKMTAAARYVSGLTHADPDCLDACALWCHAIRGAVLEGLPWAGICQGLDALEPHRRKLWADRLYEAELNGPWDFPDNGWVVQAFQAAWSAVMMALEEGSGYAGGITYAVQCGRDTDTVAAIAGAVLGAQYGVSGIRPQWINEVHGWPVTNGRDLIWIARDIAER